MRATTLAFLGCALALTGCAKKADDIQASYQQPGRYDGYLCYQLRDEAQRVARSAAEAYDEQNAKASISGVVATPRSWLHGGERSDVAVARLKGEMAAIEQSSAKNNCGVLFRGGGDGGAPQFTGVKPAVSGTVSTSRPIYNAPRL